MDPITDSVFFTPQECSQDGAVPFGEVLTKLVERFGLGDFHVYSHLGFKYLLAFFF